VSRSYQKLPRRVKSDRLLAGLITLEYSAFSVDSEDGLSMVVYTPVSPADARAIASLLSDKS